MTFGSKVFQDSRTFYAPLGVEIGVLSQKDWSGGNRPVPKERKTWVKPYTIRRVVMVKNAKGRFVKAFYDSTFYPKRVGVSVPPKRALDSPHNYTMQFIDWEDHLFTYQREGETLVRTGNAIAFTNGSLGARAQASWDSSNSELKLLNSIGEQVRGSGFNAGVFLAEGHQTLALITDSATRIASAMKHMRRGRLGAAVSVLVDGTTRRAKKKHGPSVKFQVTDRNLADKWIEIQYGWRPLLSDVHELAHHIAHRTSAPFQKSYTARRAITEKVQKDVTYGRFGEFTSTCEGRYSFGVNLKVTMKEDISLIQSLQLDNPATIVWEKLPWSFVVDWFIPIGQYLEARGSAGLLQGADIIRSQLRKCYSGTSSTVGGHFNLINMTRTVGRTVSVPRPSFKPLGKAASWQHAANAIALLIQQNRK